MILEVVFEVIHSMDTIAMERNSRKTKIEIIKRQNMEREYAAISFMFYVFF